MALDAKETRSRQQNIIGTCLAGLFLILDWERRLGRRKLGIPGFGRTSITKKIPWNYGVGFAVHLIYIELHSLYPTS